MFKIGVKKRAQLLIITGSRKRPRDWVAEGALGGEGVMGVRGQDIERIILRHTEIMKDCDRNCIALRISVNWE